MQEATQTQCSPLVLTEQLFVTDGFKSIQASVQVFKYLLQHDSSDNGQAPVIIRSNSRKKSRVDPEALQGEAALRGPDVEARTLEERSASGGALFTADLSLEHQNSAGMNANSSFKLIVV